MARVSFGKQGKDYCTYQLKNHPDTTDFAVSMVMGCPFPDHFRGELSKLVVGLDKTISRFVDITFFPYQSYHLHATVCLVIRTNDEFTVQSYLENREELNNRQRRIIEHRGLDYTEIQQQVVETHPFEISVANKEIKITNCGELLLMGGALNEEDKQELTKLRKRLSTRFDFESKEKSRVHVTLGTIGNYHKISGTDDRKVLKSDVEKLLSYTKLGSTFIDGVKLVYYTHRSLSRWVSCRPLDFN